MSKGISGNGIFEWGVELADSKKAYNYQITYGLVKPKLSLSLSFSGMYLESVIYRRNRSNSQ